MEQNANDPFANENNGTARFIGVTAGDNHSVGDCTLSAMTAMTVTSSINNTNTTQEFQSTKPPTAGHLVKSMGHTEIPQSELVKMLYYMEGELQARDVVIAALRNERVKQCISQLRTIKLQSNDPYAAIFRDKIVFSGHLVSRESSVQAAQAEMEVRQIIEQQMEQQYQMVSKQRGTHLRMVNILTESLQNNQRMLHELEEEKRKHEHDTAQGDDITYGLEIERTKLRQELEEEKVQVKKLEKDLKKMQETLEYERNRQKQIVLLLIAEQKKIMMKYVEEGKRSEDLAQILAEEKQRSDTIAEGLEEESKKSLRMEEEMEKQSARYEQEHKFLKTTLAKNELRIKELEQDLLNLRTENEALKKHQQQQQQQHQQQQIPHNPALTANTIFASTKSRSFADDGCTTAMVNIAKVVQPTATVSSVPVSAPTTGIARSLLSGHNLRSTVVGSAIAPSTQMAVALSSATTSNIEHPANSNTVVMTTSAVSISVAASTTAAPIIASTAAATVVVGVTTMQNKMQPTATIQRAPGSKYSALIAAAAGGHSHDATISHHPVPIAVPPVTVPPAGTRGAPPPIPPNKPIVPPKREPSLSRLASLSGVTNVTAAAAAAAASSATNAKLN